MAGPAPIGPLVVTSCVDPHRFRSSVDQTRPRGGRFASDRGRSRTRAADPNSSASRPGEMHSWMRTTHPLRVHSGRWPVASGSIEQIASGKEMECGGDTAAQRNTVGDGSVTTRQASWMIGDEASELPPMRRSWRGLAMVLRGSAL
jgi:hypothetical protein